MVKLALEDGKDTGFELLITNDPLAAARTPTPSTPTSGRRWARRPRRRPGRKIFAPYQVNAALFAAAKPDAIFMHCLPAHREEEVSTDIFESYRSVVFDEAENRLHAQKAIMVTLMGDGKHNG